MPVTLASYPWRLDIAISTRCLAESSRSRHAGWPGHNNEDSSDEKTDEKGITDDDESDGYRQQGNK
jgi:hypothetical protein